MDSLLAFIRANRWLLVAGIFLLGLALRLYTIDAYGFWGDEIASLDGGHLGLPGLFTQRFGWIGNQTPLHYLVVWLASLPADPTTTALWVRLPSALAGALTIPVVYGLGKEMFGRPQGLLAALLVALSAAHLNYSQDIRSYTMLVLFSALSVYCLLRAARTGSAWWWAGFAAAMALDLFFSYFALTLFLPSLALYLAWVLWGVWKKRASASRAPLYAFLSLLVIGAASAVMISDMAHTPRLSPDIAHIPFGSLLSSVMELTTWMTRFGLDGTWERLLQLGLLLLAIAGVTRAVLRGGDERISALVCGLLVVVPGLILAVLSTRYVIFQRYALFALPFYYLLISNGLIPRLQGTSAEVAGATSADAQIEETPEPTPTKEQPRRKLIPFPIPGPVFRVGMALVVLLFLVGAYRYSSPDAHGSLSYRPGFRDAAQALSRRARPEDTIIFADDPALGYTISGFYWGGKPPMPTYDVRDPLLYSHKLEGDIYWVVSGDNPLWVSTLADPSNGWAEVLRYEDVAVLREAHPTGTTIERVERLVKELENLDANYQPIKTLRGTLDQARGDTADAVAAYKSAGAYFPTGDEYLRTAKGFEALGDEGRAWREALLSKFWEPGKPEVHEWMFQKLLAEGHTEEAHAEAEIAAALR